MLVCFDYDGVLVDSFDRLLRIIQATQRTTGEGRLPEANDLRQIRTLNFQAMAERLGMPSESSCKRFEEESLRLQQTSTDLPVLFAGAAKMLDVVRSISKIVIITASHKTEVLKALEQEDAARFIDDVLDGTLRISKTERILRAAQTFGEDVSSVIMVGDAQSDIREGKAAGARTIAVTWGYQPQELLLGEEPEALVHSFSELEREIKKHSPV